ncbi:MAG: 6-carboxytetrahydropterin synthase QueD [Candidatus Eisenbacteria bacterium]|uniref:6-carboxy-5,6,7,8-tetrahydropterin synthase n=1 Tax=Eiseniibacteriota bacterium TaxID=2212470 RepID=A0A849ST48_UNCEI|nr:6-carboxytetrahydropterin synthase QueD [Candidatus Eisenbacteria bacterium]
MHVELTREYRFEAAHRLPMVPPDHKCFRMHGHSFVIEVTLAGPVDPALGWLVDFGEITRIVEPLLKRELDHRTLNDVEGLENPTSENLCGWLWQRLNPLLPYLSVITVRETCTARCTYRGALDRD